MKEEITRGQVVEVFKYLDNFLDIMVGLDETPHELKQYKDEYIELKNKVSEELRVELYARLFIKYVEICKKETQWKMV